MIKYSTQTLSNGLRIVHAPSPTPVVYCGFALDAGTRDESDREQGLAHFVEHLIFKGTEKRKAWHILNRMENVGGDLNAYTNKEETMVYAAFLKKDFARALELLTDIVFHCTFPQAEIAREVDVILDEIESYEDTPSELIFDDFENLLFQGHALGHAILGQPKQLRKFNSASGLAFTSRYYCPANAVLFVMGAIPFDRVVRMAEKLVGDLPAGTPNSQRCAPGVYLPQRVVMPKDTHQSHVLIGGRAYPADDRRRTGLYLLNNLLGGPGMNSRLNVSLREHLGLVYNVESNLTSYTDTGVFNIYFGTEPKNRDHCVELTMKELRRLCEQPLTSLQLAAAKKQLIGQIGVAGDNFENMALGMGKSYLHYQLVEGPEAVYKRIEELTATELQEIANELFVEERLTTLVYQ